MNHTLSIYVTETADVAIECVKCGMRVIIPVTYAMNVFWPEFVGNHVLKMIHHSLNCPATNLPAPLTERLN